MSVSVGRRAAGGERAGDAAARRFDIVCMGRAAVDLYGEQVGGRLEDMASFAKYLGGCPANISVGAARLGLRVAMLTRVGDEHMGRFVRETLAAEGALAPERAATVLRGLADLRGLGVVTTRAAGFLTLGGKRLQTVKWTEQLGFWGPEDDAGRHHLVYDVSPGTFR
jgi:hypothetical protein